MAHTSKEEKEGFMLKSKQSSKKYSVNKCVSEKVQVIVIKK